MRRKKINWRCVLYVTTLDDLMTSLTDVKIQAGQLVKNVSNCRKWRIAEISPRAKG